MPKERRTQLFSATMTSKVAKLQRACLDNPVKVEVDVKYRTVDTLRQQYLFIPAKHKVKRHPAKHRLRDLMKASWLLHAFPSHWSGTYLQTVGWRDTTVECRIHIFRAAGHLAI